MELNEEQKKALTQWVQSGLSLSDIQKQIESEFNLRMTYMDLRFLVDDLELQMKAEGPTFDTPEAEDLNPAPAAPGKVTVSLDKLSRPDALVSGQVTFSDGMSAQWHLDQTGRLSLDAKDPAYRPSETDLQDFQTELSELVRKSGMF